MHHIIYKTTCLVTGKYYIGMHSSEKESDRYYGSGKIIASSLKKHGKKNHKRETITTAETREGLRLLEEQIVTEDLLKDPMCMNLAVGGCGSGVGRVTTEATRAIFRAQRKGWAHMSPEVREQARKNLSAVQSARTGPDNHRSKVWILLSPEGEVIKTSAMNDFCKERGLNYFSLRNRANFNDLRPITRGDSTGWSVLSCKHVEVEELLD